MDFRSGFAQNPVFQLEFQIARSQYGRLRADPLPSGAALPAFWPPTREGGMAW